MSYWGTCVYTTIDYIIHMDNKAGDTTSGRRCILLKTTALETLPNSSCLRTGMWPSSSPHPILIRSTQHTSSGMTMPHSGRRGTASKAPRLGLGPVVMSRITPNTLDEAACIPDKAPVAGIAGSGVAKLERDG